MSPSLAWVALNSPLSNFGGSVVRVRLWMIPRYVLQYSFATWDFLIVTNSYFTPCNVMGVNSPATGCKKTKSPSTFPTSDMHGKLGEMKSFGKGESCPHPATATEIWEGAIAKNRSASSGLTTSL